MELSAPQPIFCMHKGSIIHRFSIAFVLTLIAACIADCSGTKVLSANFITNSILQRAQRFYLAW